MQLSGPECFTAIAAPFALALACTPFQDAGPLGADASIGASRSNGCVHQEPPPPPGPSVVDSGGTLDLTFAVRMTRAGQFDLDDAGQPVVGFDLDDVCTGEGQPSPCVESPQAPRDLHDGEGGIDDAFGQALRLSMLSMVPAGDGLTTPDSVPPLIRVRSYSGEANDDQVEVSAYLGLLAPRLDERVGLQWDGQDRWNVLQDTIAPSDDPQVAPSTERPLVTDKAAYVTNWTLVAHFAEARAASNLPSAPTLLYPIWGVVLAGRLVPPAGGSGAWALNDTVTGLRIAMTDLLQLFARAPVDSGMLCGDPSLYNPLKDALCSYADMLLPLNAAVGAPCNAISQSVHAQLGQVQLGQVMSPPDPPPPLTCAASVLPLTDPCGGAGR